MTTRLDKPLKRELDIDGKAHTVTFSPEGIKITVKGHRNGIEVTWKQLVSAHGSAEGGEAPAS